MRQARSVGTALVLLGLCAASLPAAAPPRPGAPARSLAAGKPDLKRLRVLLVFDTVSDLKDQLVRDEERITRVLRSTIPARLLEVKLLRGRDATRERILAYYRNLKTGPDEGLVFFYGGQGATTPEKGHSLQLQNGRPRAELARSELRKAMEAKKAGLVVILTDCCSNTRRVARSQRQADGWPVTSPDTFHPTLRSLFFQARGTVDITGATGKVSWGDDLNGGLFTRALCKMLTTSLSALKGRKDGVLTWREFFPRLRRETETTFRTWSEEMRRADPASKIDARNQTPQAFALGRAAPAEQSPVFSVVSLENAKPTPLTFHYRWSSDAAWKVGTLAPGDKACYSLSLAQTGDNLPDPAALEVQLDGSPQAHKLKGVLYVGDQPPTFDDGKKYRVRPRGKDQ
jgi:hypothetical protein